MATKPEYPRREELDLLQERLNRRGKRLEAEGEGVILTYLVRNLESQKLLAEWQDLLRNEQGILLNRMRDRRVAKRARK